MRKGRLEAEILLLGGVALAVIVWIEWRKRNKNNSVEPDMSRIVNPEDIDCPPGHAKVPLMTCAAMTPECMNAPRWGCEQQMKHTKPLDTYSSASGSRLTTMSPADMKKDAPGMPTIYWKKSPGRGPIGPLGPIILRGNLENPMAFIQQARDMGKLEGMSNEMVISTINGAAMKLNNGGRGPGTGKFWQCKPKCSSEGKSGTCALGGCFNILNCCPPSEFEITWEF